MTSFGKNQALGYQSSNIGIIAITVLGDYIYFHRSTKQVIKTRLVVYIPTKIIQAMKEKVNEILSRLMDQINVIYIIIIIKYNQA